MSDMSQELLTRLFRVDLDNGRLFWREPPPNHTRLLGAEAGSARPNQSGKLYWHVKIGGRAIKRGHIIYFLSFGHWPTPCLDHKDGNSLNDAASNLRAATATENAWNHKRRKRRINLPMGVRSIASGRYEARISFHGTQLHLGAFETPEQAHTAYVAKREELYREFA